MESQSERILFFLQGGGKLTPRDALQRFGTMRLAARIFDLRAMDHEIQERMVRVPGRNGTMALVAEYYMAEEQPELFAIPRAMEWT